MGVNPSCAPVQARAHLLSVGIMRPAPDVTAIDVNAFLMSPYGAPANAGKVAEPDKTDVPRFLNRRAPPGLLAEATNACLLLLKLCRCCSCCTDMSGAAHDWSALEKCSTCQDMTPWYAHKDLFVSFSCTFENMHVRQGWRGLCPGCLQARDPGQYPGTPALRGTCHSAADC